MNMTNSQRLMLFIVLGALLVAMMLVLACPPY